MYDEVATRGILPKTSPPTVSNFMELFYSTIRKGHDIVFIGISSKLSATIENAMLAAKEFPAGRIHVIDSLNLSSGVGLLALKAAKLVQDGLSAEKVAERIRRYVPKVETHFVIDTLDYLHMGGRCSGIANFMSSLLKIKPIIQVKNGELVVSHKPIGKAKAYEILLNKIIADQYVLDHDFVMVTHSDDYDGVKYMKTGLRKNFEINHLLENEAGCVISSHCGKAAIGIMYITD